MSQPELLPCPFCGRHPFLSIHPGDVTAYCGSCKASIKRFGYGQSCVDTVLEAWNRRETNDVGQVVDRLTWNARSPHEDLYHALNQTIGLLEMYDRDYGLPPGWREHTGDAHLAIAKARGEPKS